MEKSIIDIQKQKKSGKKITSLTAYDYTTAQMLEAAGVDIILVGDSLAMVALGHKNTLAVTMQEMLHHTRAVVKGAPHSLVVADMPFMSYQADLTEAIKNAGLFVKEAGARAVKLEGASELTLLAVKNIVDAGIPVLAHLGFTPQFINAFGGYYVQAKTAEKSEMLLEQAKDLQDAGVFGVVLEMIPSEVGKYVTDNLKVPTIGIGAGPYCDGQILVTDDLLGKYSDFTPSFVRRYANIAEISKNAIAEFCNDVKNGQFPCEKNESFNLKQDENQKLNCLKN